MDELRLSTGVAPSPAWIATEYRNQNAPGSFFTLGAQQSQSLAPETISTPSISGPASASPGTIYPYTASGAVSSLGHPLQYLFSWGDGTTSTWNLSAGASHAWMAAGTYTVTVQARCSIDTGIVSAISSPLAVTVIGVSAAATPIFNPPAGLYSTSQTVSIT
jgi:membrane associated rhomboid family serine protease